MTATINASTTAGVVTTADTSGILQLQTNGTAALTVDASQNTTLAGTLTTTGVTTFAAGTAAAPAITTTGDTNTGIFFPAADTIAFAEGGVEAVRINSSGNVGIGTSSPATRLEVRRGDTDGKVASFFQSAGYGFDFYSSQSVANVASAYLQAFTFSTNAGSGQAERARITNDGEFYVGTTTGGAGNNADGFLVLPYGLVVVRQASSTAMILRRWTSNGEIVTFRNTDNSDVGNITTTASTTAYNTSSDYRLKEAIAPMTGALAKVALLKPVTYKWKIDGSDGQGFIAHELAEVVPGCVSGEKDAVGEQEYEVTPAVKDEEGNTITEAVMGTRIGPVYQGIDTSFLVATLTAAIQELKAIVDAQGAEIAALKGATA